MFGIQVEYKNTNSAKFAKDQAKNKYHRIKYKTIDSTTVEFLSQTIECTSGKIALDNDFYINLDGSAFAAKVRAITKRRK